MEVEVEREGSWHVCRVLDVLSREGLCTCAYRDEDRVEPGIDIAARVRKTTNTDEDYLESRVQLENLEPEQQIGGRVVRITSFGAFVDVGAEEDGLLHVSQIHPGYVKSVRDHLRLGQEIVVKVLEVTDTLQLSMLQPLTRVGNRNVSALVGIPPNQWLKARVFGIVEWGAWLDVAVPPSGTFVRGMMHRSEISGSYIRDVSAELERGQWVSVRVLQCDPKRDNLLLSMRRLDLERRRSPPEDLFGFEDVSDETWLTATVVDTSTVGVLVDVEPPWGGDPVCGLVNVLDIREGLVRNAAKEVRSGQKVDVRVLGVDEEAGRLVASMKSPWDDELE